MQEDSGFSDFQRHFRRWGVYLLWLLTVYAPIAVLASVGNDTDRFFHPKGLFNCLLLIPVALAIWQMIYPTFYGWVVILVPTILYVFYAVFVTVRMLLKTRLWGGWEREDFTDACALSGVAVMVCVALVILRPRLTPSTHVT